MKNKFFIRKFVPTVQSLQVLERQGIKMSAEKYVNGIVKKIKCSSKRKKMIRQDLLEEMRVQTEQGIALEDVMLQMGTIQEVADSFNENLGADETKRYKTQKTMKIVLAVLGVLVVLIVGIGAYLPRYTNISDSNIFAQEQVEKQLVETIALLDQNEYEVLQASAIEEMKTALTEQTMQTVKNQIAGEWGEQKSIGQVYMSEIAQLGKHYVACQVTVLYENVSVTYTITYDEQMQLAGVYMR